ncbi:hypothetical protein ACT3RU_17880, partial [Halomonas sp. TP35]
VTQARNEPTAPAKGGASRPDAPPWPGAAPNPNPGSAGRCFAPGRRCGCASLTPHYGYGHTVNHHHDDKCRLTADV